MLPAVVILTGVLVYAPILAWLLLKLDEGTRQPADPGLSAGRAQAASRAVYHLPREITEHDAA